MVIQPHKKTTARETLLAYLYFNKLFNKHTEASNLQLWAVISQNNKSITFYSHKLNPAQTHYTKIEKELFTIVQTLKDFKNILLSQQLCVYTDHKNISYATHNLSDVMYLQLLVEEFNPTLICTPGETNILADALNRERSHCLLWADNANVISNLYAGTNALKGDFT